MAQCQVFIAQTAPVHHLLSEIRILYLHTCESEEEAGLINSNINDVSGKVMVKLYDVLICINSRYFIAIN